MKRGNSSTAAERTNVQNACHTIDEKYQGCVFCSSKEVVTGVVDDDDVATATPLKKFQGLSTAQ